MALLHNCLGFIFRSNQRSEAYGLSLAEAAMCGKPMISCEVGTGTSYVNKAGETGLVVPPSDPERLAKRWSGSSIRRLKQRNGGEPPEIAISAFLRRTGWEGRMPISITNSTAVDAECHDKARLRIVGSADVGGTQRCPVIRPSLPA
nr:glycosyltransferase [Mesorhizobium sp. B2-4-14]